MNGEDVTHYLDLVVERLRKFGLQVDLAKGASGFVPGVRIHEGGIVFDPDHAQPSNLLHEAGHLAVIPSQFRALATDDISKVQKHMISEIDALFDQDSTQIDSPLCRAVMQSGDPEATAWAFAAGREIGVPDEQIILDEEYGGEGQFVRLGLSMNAYVGINGLVASGMCTSTKTYPAMRRWLQS